MAKGIYFCIVFLLSFSKVAFSGNDKLDILNGYSFTTGFSLNRLDFNYYNPDSAVPAGSMTEGAYSTYFLQANSPYSLTSNKKWGYYFEYGYSNFSMHKQNVAGKEKNIGSFVNGSFLYATPIVFYLVGAVPKGEKELSLILGLGVGLGYMNAKGNLILTEDGSNKNHKVNETNINLSSGALFEVHYGNFVTRLYMGGATSQEPIESKNGFYSVGHGELDIGYQFHF